VQAEDRCHRIGQTKSVTVYKLVAKETVDADIFRIGSAKRETNEALLEGQQDAAGEKGCVRLGSQRLIFTFSGGVSRGIVHLISSGRGAVVRPADSVLTLVMVSSMCRDVGAETISSILLEALQKLIAKRG
jgi:hypothetical protein